jgi:hypothetical protein
MNEGDYLIAANLLRNVHNIKPVNNELQRTYTFDSPIKIIKINKYMEEDDGSEFIIKEIMQTRTYRGCCWNIENVKCNIYRNDVTLSWSKFCKLLDNYLKINLYLNFKVTNYLFNVSHIFDFSEYSKFFIQQRDDVCEDSDMCEDKWIYSEYIQHVVERIKECIQINCSE